MPVSYSDLLALARLAEERGWVVQSVEGYEVEEDGRRLRMDATWSYPHEEYSDRPTKTARDSSAFIQVVLAGVTDRSDLIYEVWIDPQDVPAI